MPRSLPLIAQIVAVVIWSTTFVASAEALTGVSPALLTVLRFALAAAVLVPLALARRGLGRTLLSPASALLGLTGVAAYYGLQNLGLLSTTAGTAALLQAVIPIAAAVLGFVLLRERLNVGSIAGLTLATLGIVVASNTGATLNIGALLIAAGAAAYALYTVMLRKLELPDSRQRTRVTTEPIVLAAATAVWGLVCLAPWLIWEMAAGEVTLMLTGPVVVSVLYLGLFASGATLLLWTYGARSTPAVTSGILTAAIPALGYGFALLAGEAPTGNRTIGGLLALLGVGLAIASSLRARHRASGR